MQEFDKAMDLAWDKHVDMHGDVCDKVRTCLRGNLYNWGTLAAKEYLEAKQTQYRRASDKVKVELMEDGGRLVSESLAKDATIAKLEAKLKADDDSIFGTRWANKYYDKCTELNSAEATISTLVEALEHLSNFTIDAADKIVLIADMDMMISVAKQAIAQAKGGSDE